MKDAKRKPVVVCHDEFGPALKDLGERLAAIDAQRYLIPVFKSPMSKPTTSIAHDFIESQMVTHEALEFHSQYLRMKQRGESFHFRKKSPGGFVLEGVDVIAPLQFRKPQRSMKFRGRVYSFNKNAFGDLTKRIPERDPARDARESTRHFENERLKRLGIYLD